MEIDKIITALKSEGWSFYKNENTGTYTNTYEGDNVIFEQTLDLSMLKKHLIIAEFYLPIQVPREKNAELAHYLNDLNFDIEPGYFILNFKTGKISFRSTLDFKGSQLQIGMVVSCLTGAGFIANDRYEHILLKL